MPANMTAETERMIVEHHRWRKEAQARNTPNLPSHDPEATCPKCGADARQVMTEYHGESPDPVVGSLFMTPSKLPCKDKTLSEHLCRTCGRCGYSWQERTVDMP